MELGRGTQKGAGWNSWILIAVLAGAGPAFGQTGGGNESGQPRRINIRVHNYAQVSDQVLMRGEKGAADIFRKTGMEISWVNCHPGMTGIRRDANCTPQDGPLNFDLRIVQGIVIVTGASDGETMGLAFRNLASVSIGQVVKEAAAGNIDPWDVLGMVIAHETGHLLLGPNSHSKTGIMQPRWSGEDYRRGARGQVLFTPQQAERIRGEVKERAQTQTAAPAATVTAAK